MKSLCYAAPKPVCIEDYFSWFFEIYIDLYMLLHIHLIEIHIEFVEFVDFEASVWPPKWVQHKCLLQREQGLGQQIPEPSD
jgi:hypothetical protein